MVDWGGVPSFIGQSLPCCLQSLHPLQATHPHRLRMCCSIVYHVTVATPCRDDTAQLPCTDDLSSVQGNIYTDHIVGHLQFMRNL